MAFAIAILPDVVRFLLSHFMISDATFKNLFSKCAEMVLWGYAGLGANGDFVGFLQVCMEAGDL